MPEQEDQGTRPTQNQDLLKEIRENFQYAVDGWRDIREEGQKDMKYLAGDPWDEKERRARENAGRPCLALDELGQYINQLINDVRQNKRSIRVAPKGQGANDEEAELRGNKIREIEYRSNAQAAYITAFENAASRSYGYFRIGTRYVRDDSFDQELYIGRIPNPNAVYLDPDYQKADASDMNWGFVIQHILKKRFLKDYPKAEKRDFDAEGFKEVSGSWLKGDRIQVAEYWKVEGQEVDFPEGDRTRKVQKRKVTQYLTNGVEILEENDWGGEWIPIIPVFGKEIYVDKGRGDERVLMSMVRLARDPYMLYCYYRTCQAELVGMTPKTPYIGYEGQFEGHEDDWKNINKIPLAYLEVKPQLDATAGAVLPLPERQKYEPQIAALELGAEAARRAIQAAMGITALPTAAQRRSEKSGIALERIEAQQQKGSFHFIDNYNLALEHAGRILDDKLDTVYDTARETGILKADDSYALVKLNQPDKDEKGKPIERKFHKGEYDVTISTGPSFQSQREEAQVFVDTLAANPQLVALALQNPQSTAAKLLSLAIRLRNLGPLGDEMAEAIDPSKKDGDMPPQAMAMMQKLDQERQQLNAYAQQIEEQLKAAQAKEQAKVLELQSRERIATENNQVKMAVEEMKAEGAAMQVRMQAEFDGLQAQLEARLASLQPQPQVSPAAEG